MRAGNVGVGYFFYQLYLFFLGNDTDELDNLPEDEYDEEVVEFLLKVEEIILDEE